MGRLFLDFRNFRQHEPDLTIFCYGGQKGGSASKLSRPDFAGYQMVMLPSLKVFMIESPLSWWLFCV